MLDHFVEREVISLNPPDDRFAHLQFDTDTWTLRKCESCLRSVLLHDTKPLLAAWFARTRFQAAPRLWQDSGLRAHRVHFLLPTTLCHPQPLRCRTRDSLMRC